MLEQEESEEEQVISEHDKDVLHKSLGEEAAKILGDLDINHGSAKSAKFRRARKDYRGHPQ